MSLEYTLSFITICLVVVKFSLLMDSIYLFTHIRQDTETGTQTIMYFAGGAILWDMGKINISQTTHKCRIREHISWNTMEVTRL